MLRRYSDDKINFIWSDQNRFAIWQNIELIYLNNILEEIGLRETDSGFVFPTPAHPDLTAIYKYEKDTKHELVAFLKELSFRLSKYNSSCPQVNRYLHYGLTSSDIIDTTFSLQLAESIDYLIFLFIELKSEVTDKMINLKELKSIGRTHGKHAEEISFSDRFRLFNSELFFCLEKLIGSKKNLYGKLKGPVGTSSFVYKDAASKTLDFLNLNEVPFGTQVIPRFYYTDVMYTLVMIASCYERFATFIRLSAINEIDEIQESFAKNQAGSSAMPHKNNPVISENICGLARYIKSNFQVALDNNNLWWERDISHSSNERIIWPETFHLVCNLTKKMTSLIQTIDINKNKITKNLQNSESSSHEELLNFTKNSNRFTAYEEVKKKYHN